MLEGSGSRAGAFRIFGSERDRKRSDGVATQARANGRESEALRPDDGEDEREGVRDFTRAASSKTPLRT